MKTIKTRENGNNTLLDAVYGFNWSTLWVNTLMIKKMQYNSLKQSIYQQIQKQFSESTISGWFSGLKPLRHHKPQTILYLPSIVWLYSQDLHRLRSYIAQKTWLNGFSTPNYSNASVSCFKSCRCHLKCINQPYHVTLPQSSATSESHWTTKE